VKLPFDRVCLLDERGSARDVELDEFLSMPLHDRIQTILERRVRFFRGSEEVQPLSALKALNSAQA